MLGVLFIVTRARTGIDNFRGFNHFIFFKAHFLSANVFQGEGVLFVTQLLLICGVGVDMVEKSTRWVGYGGVTWILNKNVQINFISFVLFDVALNGTHVEDVEDYRNICIVVSCINVEDI